MTTNTSLENAETEYKRLAEVVAAAEDAAAEAGAAVSEASATVTELTGRIVRHDDSAGASFAALSAERTAARDRLENLSPRLSARMDELASARTALHAAGTALTAERSGPATAEYQAKLGVFWDGRLPAVARELASEVVAIDRLRGPAEALSTRVQLDRGVEVERLMPLDAGPGSRVDLITARLAALLIDEIASAMAEVAR